MADRSDAPQSGAVGGARNRSERPLERSAGFMQLELSTIGKPVVQTRIHRCAMHFDGLAQSGHNCWLRSAAIRWLQLPGDVRRPWENLRFHIDMIMLF